MKRIILAGILFASPQFADQVFAQTNATTLYEPCKRSEITIGTREVLARDIDFQSARSFCYSYITGVVESERFLSKENPAYCNSVAVTDKQMAGIFISYYERHYAMRFSPAVEVLLKALADQFPCKK